MDCCLFFEHIITFVALLDVIGGIHLGFCPTYTGIGALVLECAGIYLAAIGRDDIINCPGAARVGKGIQTPPQDDELRSIFLDLAEELRLNLDDFLPADREEFAEYVTSSRMPKMEQILDNFKRTVWRR